MDTEKGREISKHHATIERRFINGINKWFIIDNQSLNGTFLNLKKVKQHILNVGDEIVFGGGQEFHYGQKLPSSEKSECRYRFIENDKKLVFSPQYDPNIILPDYDHLEECPICYDNMEKFYTLQCGHSFCLSCIRPWTQKCILDRIATFCPICREPFNPDVVLFGDAIDTGETMMINNIVPFLRKLKARSINEISELSINFLWDEEKRNRFWAYHNICFNKPIKFLLFLFYTNSTFNSVIDADEKSLMNIVTNLDGNNKLCGAMIREEAIILVSRKIRKLL